MKNQLFIQLLLFVIFCSSYPIAAQQITINEVAASNSSFLDEDGDARDWIELYNAEEEAINLEGWAITDKIDQPDKWIFPAETISPKSYLLLFASGKDRSQPMVYRTVVAVGDDCQYIIPTANTSSDWRSLSFDDSNWLSGETGIGYGDNDDNTLVDRGTEAVFIRQYFELSQPELVEELLFQVDYDDACAAYLNGVEIARTNLPNTQGTVPYNARPFRDREAVLRQGGALEVFEVEDPTAILNIGTNVLAVQVHNISSSSSDLSIFPYLSYSATEPIGGNMPPVELDLNDAYLHTNFKIKAGETVYLFNPAGALMDSLAIPLLPTDISFGKFPDGTATLEIFEKTTPNAANRGEGIKGVVTEEVSFSKLGGPQTRRFSLELSGGREGDIIRYTKDGSDPQPFSNSYAIPLIIDANTVIKAAIFRNDYLPSLTTTQSYLFNADHDLPVISISFKSTDFFNPTDGIYELGLHAEEEFPHFGANFWEDEERPIHIDFFELGGDLGFSADAGAKIFGGWSRGFEQKSLSIFFRSQYGTNVLDYPLFEDRPYEEYEAFVLRNSGNDWTSTMMRDLTLTGLMKNSHVDIQAGRPSIVYLNGDYWGIYNIREKINEHYLAALHDIPTEDITILEKDSKVIFGDNTEYISLIEQANKLDLTIPENYDSVANQIDLANYIQYHIAQIYINNTDWPGNNNKFWKAKNGKWRWILFDTDFGFSIWSNNDHFRNTLAFALNPAGPPWPNPPWSTLLFRRLMTNQQFMERFINTFADEINTRFLPDSVIEQIEKKEEAIRFEIPQQIKQWSAFSMLGWRDRVDVMKTFASQRPRQMRGYIQSYFGLPSQRTVQVKIENPTHGSVQLNTIQLTEADWEGIYFESVPITLTALPKAGFLFERWSGSLTSTETTITIDPTQPLTLTAHFTRVDSEVLETDIIINEINYNSNEEQDAGDWIELHNRGSVPQNISDWVFKDGNDEHNFVLPQGTVLPTNGYLVLTSNTDKFKQQFPAVQNQIGDFDFKLSSEGELVRLYNRDSILIDSIRYAPTDGWPEEANGLGPTLELLHPDSDNAQRDSWTTYAFTGTPGAENGVYITSTTEYLNTLAVEVYPNPFSDNLIFNVSLPSTAPITLQVMNLTGQVVLRQVDVWLSPNQSYPVNMTTFPKGAYWIRLESKEGVAIKKVVKL